MPQAPAYFGGGMTILLVHKGKTLTWNYSRIDYLKVIRDGDNDDYKVKPQVFIANYSAMLNEFRKER